jgi:uroporphyrinogen III methyltransferase/synthase
MSRLEALGAVPLLVPGIRIEFTDPGPLDAALTRLRDYDWVIFTSRHAVEAVFRRRRSLSGPRVAAVGRATAGELVRHGVVPDLVPREFVGERLLDALGPVAGLRVLLPRADIGRRTIPEGLAARGAAVDEVVVYRTVAGSPSRPDLTGVDAVTFTSPSTVHGFLESGPLPAGARVLCIGPVTAAAAREHGLEVHEVAGEYTEDGLVAALIEALHR